MKNWIIHKPNELNNVRLRNTIRIDISVFMLHIYLFFFFLRTKIIYFMLFFSFSYLLLIFLRKYSCLLQHEKNIRTFVLEVEAHQKTTKPNTNRFRIYQKRIFFWLPSMFCLIPIQHIKYVHKNCIQTPEIFQVSFNGFSTVSHSQQQQKKIPKTVLQNLCRFRSKAVSFLVVKTA